MKAVLFVAAFVLSFATYGQTYQAESDGIKVIVYDQPCALKEIVNLPKRATWTEKGKTTEGCAGVDPRGIVLFYWGDRTVVIVPVQNFVRMTDA